METNNKKIGDYIIEKKIGKGQYGKVYRARHVHTNQMFAIKQISRKNIDMNPYLLKLLHSEVAIMYEISHPNIIKLYEFLSSKENYYLVLQYCSQGDMESYMKLKNITKFPENEAIELLKQIMNGFFELRKRKILHRDFKLANIFMHNEVAIIGDFGFAKTGMSMAETKLGSPLTMAPELMFGSDEAVVYNAKADLWSIGVVFYQLVFGTPPFFAISPSEMLANIKKNAGKNLKFPISVSPEVEDFLIKILEVDPHKRIEWSSCFRHPIFNLYKSQKNDYAFMTSTNDNFRSEFKINDNVIEEIKQSVIPQEGNLKKSTMGMDLHYSEIEKNQIQKNYYVNLEFNENMKNVSKFDNIDFGKKNDILERKMTIFPVKDVLETTIDNQNIKTIEEDNAFREISYRFNHEKNKALFLVFAVKKIQALVKMHVFQENTLELFFYLSFMLLKKAIKLCDLLERSLKDRSNLLFLNQMYFKSYLDSVYSMELSKSVKFDRNMMTEYLRLITLRMYKLDVREPSMIQEFDVKSMDRYIKKTIGELIADFENGRKKEVIPKQKWQHLLVILIHTVKLEEDFPYLMDREKAMKFSWGKLYQVLENSSEGDLAEILKLMNDWNN